MNLRELEKSTEELKFKNRENEDNINLNQQRINTMKENSLGIKMAITASISMITYAVLLILIIVNGVSILPSFIPLNLISPTIALTSIISGVFGEKMLRKFKIGNNKNSKDNIKTMEEKIKLEIELEQAKNKDVVLQNSIEILNTNENVIRLISNETNVIDSTLKEENIKDLNINLEERYKNLDELTIKKVINDKFWIYKDKTKPFIKVLSISTITALSSMVALGIPNIILSDLLTYSNMYSALLGITVPYVVGGVTGALYTIKNNKDNKKVYKKLKQEFNLENYDNKLIEKEIEETIKNISNLEIKIQKKKRINEKISELKVQQKGDADNLLNNNNIQNYIVEENDLEIKGQVKKIGQKK